MSKSSTTSASKTSSQLPSKSAWAKGPPANTSTAPSPRPQSPAPSVTAPSAPTTHSRRPSTLGQGVAFKDGVGARTPTNGSKAGSSVTFGSIDDASAPISSSPASVPTIKPDGIKSFGSVPAASTNGKMHSRTTSFSTGTPPSAASTSSATASSSTAASSSTPKRMAFDVKSLFQNKSTDGPSSSTTTPASPSTRPAPLPQSSLSAQGGQHHHQASPSQMGAPYSNFRPPQPNGMPVPSPGGPPRSPSFPRQVPNGNVNGRPPAPPGPPSAGLPQAMPSPRLGPPPHGGQPPQAVPQGAPVPMPQWGYYYYPGMPVDPNYNPYQTPQWLPQHMPPQHHPPQGPQGAPMSGMPMSPRGQPPPLHAPGTPTLTPALPPPAHPTHSTPSPHTHTSSLSSISSSTPSTPQSSSAPGGGLSRLNSSASAFTPGKRVVIKSVTGQEVDLDQLKKHATPAAVSSPIVPSSPARRTVPVRMETEEAKKKRLAEEEAERAKKEAEKAKKEAEAKAKKEAEEKAKRDAEEKAKREEEEKRQKEEEERRRKEQEEEEKRQKEEERKQKEAEEERLRKEAEEKARKEEEERAAKEAEAKAKAEEAKAEPEEGEVQETADATDEAIKEEAKDKVSDKAPLRIDTTLTPSEGKRRPGRLDLSSTKNPAIPAPLPSALATARIIEDIGSIQYPEGVMSPKPELNVNAKQGKFRYDRDFLLQFMAVCKEKPDSLPPLDAIGLEPVDQSFAMTRGGSHGRRSSSSTMPPPSRQGSVGLGISGFNKPAVNPFTMGQFSTPKMSSEERFAQSNRSASMSGGPAGMPFGRPSPMVRSSSQGGAGHSNSGRTRSQRGNKRGEKDRTGGPSGPGGSYGQQSMLPPVNLEPVAPLEVSANRWTPASLTKKGQPTEQESPEVVDRKVRALLNKLTMARFDSISDQIIEWANKSEKEKDGRTLIQVIRLVFEKATDEATWSEMYARLCRKMMEQISPNVRDDGIKNAEGKPIAGGQLFRKYLLNRCQEDFERGWVAKEATAAAAATKATEDQAVKAANEANKEGEDTFSEEYYAAQKAKRQGLGLIKFIGELFKLQMLTERIMHECVKKLLGNVENPEEEEIESLCKLLTTVGQILDTPKARAHMDVYFSRMKELTKSPNVNSRMQFMLQDVIELRERKWIPRNQMAAPTTLAAIHELALKEKAAADKEAMNRTLSMSRGGSRRGGDRGDHSQVGPDGWAVAGGPATRPASKAGDLSKFGQINKQTPMTFGPSSVFQKGDKTKSRESTIRAGSTNMFSMLSGNPELAAEVPSGKSSRPPSRKNSIDLGSGGAPDAAGQPQRKRLQLLPRSVPVENKSESTPGASAANSDDEGAESTTGGHGMSEAEAKTRIEEDSKEFFSIRDLEEAEVYFTKLPSEHRHMLVDKLVTKAIESKEADAQLVADLFDRAVSRNLCSPASFEEGFTPTAEILDDIVIDAPKALNLFAIMMKGAHLHEDEERRTRLASKSMDSDKLVGLLT
ncbi:hypothetical protein L227DRAFT_551661 [Lentinus tigrinus ALCF2SS1-6]|uniref:MI domain-containing protein n=1 Tax=Lentinus tigrinus ALCF2SS1-6 TaxID=1328759 RepID=A0A5C2S2F8_9APHY|nr:hypothetical protein L227DRAFT_551661 [Lentinus tigrinus ALCF2SS1-6]